MAHPFYKMLDSALDRSSELDNQVLVEAEKLHEKGYRAVEIHAVLTQLAAGRIDDTERAIAEEAAEEFSRHLENQE